MVSILRQVGQRAVLLCVERPASCHKSAPALLYAVRMSTRMILACLWALAATGVAFLPMRLQYAPGLALLIAAPALLAWIGGTHSVGITLFAGLAVLLMFRRPLFYFARRAFAK